MIIKFKKFVKESIKEGIGNIILNIDGEKSTWFYYRDAIIDGLFKENLDITEDEISMNFENDIKTIDDLADMLDDLSELEFPQEIKEIFDILNIDIEYIIIKGISEDGNKYNYEYYKK
jgi:ACT domain-containing protein